MSPIPPPQTTALPPNHPIAPSLISPEASYHVGAGLLPRRRRRPLPSAPAWRLPSEPPARTLNPQAARPLSGADADAHRQPTLLLSRDLAFRRNAQLT